MRSSVPAVCLFVRVCVCAYVCSYIIQKASYAVCIVGLTQSYDPTLLTQPKEPHGFARHSSTSAGHKINSVQNHSLNDSSSFPLRFKG